MQARAPSWYALSFAAVLTLTAAAGASQWRAQLEDGDAQTYRIVTRHMVEDGTWFDLRYLPGLRPQFREHLPFGFWPFAAAELVAGEGAPKVAALLFSLGAVALVMAWARRRLGPEAAIAAGLVLALTESFSVYGGRERLDPQLVFFATAAVVALWWDERLRPWPVALCLLSGAAAALVKGPFGVLPLFAASCVTFWQHRTAKRAFALVALLAATCLPVTAFLLWDKWWGGGTWWDGYARAQLFASATGGRVDGRVVWWYPWATLAGRFWPGLPLVAFGLFRAARDRSLRPLGTASLIVVMGLCVPVRKLWNHALVAYPLLAWFGAAAVAPWLRTFFASPARAFRTAVALSAVALAGVVAAAAGAGQLWVAPPPFPSGPVTHAVDGLPPNAEVLVVSPSVEWWPIASLAAERRLVPWPARSLEDTPPGAHATFALARPDTAQRAGWREVARDARWVVYRAAP